jgi:hypothetical protein
MDHGLAQIVDAAEANARCPLIRILVGGVIIIGDPISTEGFYSRTRASLHTEVESESKRRRWRSAVPEQSSNEVLAGLQSVARPPDHGGALSIGNATVKALAGEEWDVAALRVPLDRIDAWWLVRAGVRGDSKGSAGLAVGVVGPVDF